ncbi:MAG TPA: fructosamine kinase family protein [Rhodothermales bacterium]|nr:fructosamine kinase family protein [Rhodothermales bacterium]
MPYLDGPIRSCERVGGGCIAQASCLRTKGSRYFLKWGDSPVGDTFQAEAFGLGLLRDSGSPLVVPQALAVEAPGVERPGFLLLEWVDAGSPPVSFWEDFGRGLAVLHRNASGRYGADQDNFIGRLPQANRRMESWPAFFRECRLEPQLSMARERGVWRSGWDPLLERLYNRLDDLLPARPEASVLHGDLWSGNYMVTTSGRAALIDPAAYHGHREVDLAMTELFGGFRAGFYDAYREAWPLAPGYSERKEIYNLYHLINHLNHFGQSYAGSVSAILGRYG